MAERIETMAADNINLSRLNRVATYPKKGNNSMSTSSKRVFTPMTSVLLRLVTKGTYPFINVNGKEYVVCENPEAKTIDKKGHLYFFNISHTRCNQLLRICISWVLTVPSLTKNLEGMFFQNLY